MGAYEAVSAQQDHMLRFQQLLLAIHTLPIDQPYNLDMKSVLLAFNVESASIWEVVVRDEDGVDVPAPLQPHEEDVCGAGRAFLRVRHQQCHGTLLTKADHQRKIDHH